MKMADVIKTKVWEGIFNKGIEVKKVDRFVKEFCETYKTKVLDLGCGTGRHSVHFAQKGFCVFALDNSQSALANLERRLQDKPYKQNVTLVRADITNLQYSDDFFDIVVSTRVLHHGYQKQINSWFKEIYRVLKTNGFLVMSVLSSNDKRAVSGIEMENGTRLSIDDTFDPEVSHHFFTLEEIKNQLEGFKVIYAKESLAPVAKGYGHMLYYYVIARKRV